MGPLTVGELTVELVGPDLRAVTWRGIEVVNRLYGAVRSDTWATVPGRLGEVTIDTAPGRAVVSFVVDHRDGGAPVTWTGRYELSTDTLVATFDAEVTAPFDTNRIGWCLLHPLNVLGGGVVWRLGETHSRRRISPAVAPQAIGDDGILRPCWGPFDALTVHGPVRAEFVFEGDEFETEDQRNWTDASFKTYSTPLSRPTPRRLVAGDRVRQQVTLRLGTGEPGRGQLGARGLGARKPSPGEHNAGEHSTGEHSMGEHSTEGARDPARQQQLYHDAPWQAWPLGRPAPDQDLAATPDTPQREPQHDHNPLWLATLRRPLPDQDLAAVLDVVDSVRAFVRAGTAGDVALASATIAQAARVPGWELAVEATPDVRWGELRRILDAATAPSRVFVLPVAATGTAEETTTVALQKTAETELDIHATAGGTLLNFAELQRHDLAHLFATSFTYSPVVHADDDRSIWETLESYPSIVATARMHNPGPISVGPLRDDGPLPDGWVAAAHRAWRDAGADIIVVPAVEDLARDGILTSMGREIAHATNEGN